MYVIIYDKVYDNTYFYRTQSELESKYLFLAVTFTNCRDLVVYSSDECDCKNMQEISSVSELFSIVGYLTYERSVNYGNC